VFYGGVFLGRVVYSVVAVVTKRVVRAYVLHKYNGVFGKLKICVDYNAYNSKSRFYTQFIFRH